MTLTNSPDPRAQGALIRTARRARVRAIRRRVVGGAVVLFVALWMLIAVTLISGHDPALAKRSTSSKTSGGTGTTATLTSPGSSTSSGDTGSSTSSGNTGSSTSSGNTGSSTSSGNTGSSTSSGTGSSSSGLGSVTTSQS